MSKITFSKSAWVDYLYWQKHDKKILKKINQLILEAARTPDAGLGKPEKLKHQLAGCYSRRINQEHRFVYRIYEKTHLEVVSLRFHYE